MPVPLKVEIAVDGQAGAGLPQAIQLEVTRVIEAKQATLAQVYGRAAKRVADKDKETLRADIVAGGFYKAQALSKTWRGAAYPKSAKGSLEPAVFLSTKARVIVEAFSEGVTITAKRGRFLAIAQGPAKAIVRRLNTPRARSGVFSNEAGTVDRVAAELGVKLKAIIGADGNGVLVADDDKTLTPTGRVAKRQRGKATVLFILVRQATLKKRITGPALLKRIEANFLADFASAVQAELPSDEK